MPENSFAHTFRLFVHRYFPYLAFLAVVAVGTTATLLMLYPLWNRIQSTGAFEYEQLLAMKENREVELGQLDEMRVHLAEVNQSQLLSVERLLPSEYEPAQLMERVERSLLAEHFTLTSIDIVEEEASTEDATIIPGVRPVHVSVNVSGDASYEGMKQFLATLAMSNPILDLSSISYSPSLESFSLVLTTYVAE